MVFTDGHETASKRISEVADLITNREFAIGLGTADQLNPGALNDLVDGTGGYLLLTGNPGPDDQILLQKYFAQVVAGVTNSVIVVDPEGLVPLGDEAVVPYDLTAAETRSDVIVLSPAADALLATLEAPDGTTINATSGADLVMTQQYQTLRLSLQPPVVSGTTAGTWRAHLKLDRDKLGRWLKELEERKDQQTIVRVRTHGVPFTLTVQARSSLRLGVSVAQPSRRPGTKATLTATLTESGIPLSYSARFDALVTAPNGTVSTIPLTRVDEGVFRGLVVTPTPGVYRVLVRAEGKSLRGQPFTRQELRTLAVWARGDERVEPPTAPIGPDVCSLLTCLLEDQGVIRLAKERGIDIERLRMCLDQICS